MVSLERILQGIKHQEIKLGVSQDESKRIAEFLSSRSAPAETIFSFQMTAQNSYQAILLIFLCSFRNFWETDREHQILANQCFKYNYQGQWAKVQELLETQDQSVEGIVNKIIELTSEDEFFGNVIPRALRLLRIFRNKFWKESKRPPKRKIRRRGYDDKGTLRPIHDHHGIPGSYNPDAPERIDRRKNISHPLLKEKDPGEG